MLRHAFWLILLVVFFSCAPSSSVFAEGYLSGSAEAVDPRPSAMSWWSTLAYLLSLLAAFVFVVVLAYLASRFLSGRFARSVTGEGGRILAHLPLGPNRSVCVVELAGRVFMLGVTEHSITLLVEVEDEAEIDRLIRRGFSEPEGSNGIFSSQFGSFEQLAKRIPSLFQSGSRRR